MLRMREGRNQRTARWFNDAVNKDSGLVPLCYGGTQLSPNLGGSGAEHSNLNRLRVTEVKAAFCSANFLTGKPLPSLPHPSQAEIRGVHYRHLWRFLERPTKKFGRRSGMGELNRMSQEQEGHTCIAHLRRPIIKRHVVLLHEKWLPPQFWKMKWVVNVLPDRDAKLRSRGVIRATLRRNCCVTASTVVLLITEKQPEKPTIAYKKSEDTLRRERILVGDGAGFGSWGGWNPRIEGRFSFIKVAPD